MITHVFPLSRVQEAFQLRNSQVEAACGVGGAEAEDAASVTGVKGAARAIHVLIDCESTSDEVQVLLRD